MAKYNDLPDFDTDGFLRETDAWNEDLARRIAVSDGLGELEEPQLCVLRQLRESYQRHGTPPALAHVCHMSGFSQDCMYELFPSAREAWRIAGLPHPGEEAKVYL